MKKIITVLTILAVLAGALFATSESHSIKITVTIDNSEPTFTLKTTSGADQVSTTADAAAVEAALSSANKTALAGASGTADVGFAIQQTSNANSVSTYRLYVTVSDLVLTSNGSPLENPTSTEKFTVVSAHPTISGGDTVTNITYPVPEVADEYYRVKYDGVVNLTNATPITLGTFTVSYSANANAKPGDYVSTVSLSIETP